MADKRELKQSGKGSGARDAKSLARNANRTLEAPDMPDMTEGSVSLEGPDDETLGLVVQLRRRGRTFPQIAQALGIPVETLHEWKADNPEFFEQSKSGFDDWVDEKAEEVLQLADKLPAVRGLKPGEKVIALKHQIAARLQVAAARLPAWGKQSTGDGGFMIIDVGLGGPIKTTGLPGSEDGQNVLALKAGRWTKELPAPAQQAAEGTGE